MMRNKHGGVARILTLSVVTLISGCSSHLSLLHPEGPIGAHEVWVIGIAFALMLIVVIPVFVMTFLFAWRYRASNTRATYTPNWGYSKKIELVVWLVPAVIVISLGILLWKTTHELSPYRPLASTQKPVKVEAVAMDWKWLFIYPQQHIASVNRLVFPAKAPLSLRLTSDTVMTSFFIPRLGSQIYAMPGMRTKLHLLADKPGTYTGRNFQFSGRGYSAMHFKAVATSKAGFRNWVSRVRQSQRKLNVAAFKRLATPSVGHAVTYYASVRPHLFDYIMRQYRTANAARPPSNVHRGA
ncbi:MAG: ubiquinol oxidase subunit II [Gammaproteobacteria bacterium]